MAGGTLEQTPAPPEPGERLRRSVRERLAAWALTGPPGRVWSFGRDLASAAPMLVRYWSARLRGKQP
jgi:hypothetical protein